MSIPPTRKLSGTLIEDLLSVRGTFMLRHSLLKMDDQMKRSTLVSYIHGFAVGSGFTVDSGVTVRSQT
jgi:hypothetical protein